MKFTQDEEFSIFKINTFEECNAIFYFYKEQLFNADALSFEAILRYKTEESNVNYDI